MHITFIAKVIGYLFLARVLFSVLRGVFSPLRSIPGPTAARFTNFWYFWRVRKGYWQQENIGLHRRYGEVVRYGPNRFSFSSASALKAIYGAGVKFPKSSWYDAFGRPDPDQWSLFTDRNIKRHGENRRQFQSAYSMTSLINYEGYVNECADIFSQRLREIAAAGEYMDIGYWFLCYGYDLIGLMTFSKRYGFLDAGDDVGNILASLERFQKYAALVGIFSWIHPFLFALNTMMGGNRISTTRTFMADFTRARIEEHEKDPERMSLKNGLAASEVHERPEDFLTKFFAKNIRNPETFTTYHLRVGCESNIVAGSDTTATGLSSIMYHLLKSPQALEKLRQEIRQSGNRTCQHVTLKEAQSMPYLQAVIKESLRLCSVSGFPLERVVPAGGAEICNRFFPEGTIVGINVWVAHRNPLVFGTDADEFKPERWLIEDKERLSAMEHNWMPFGAGSRVCIGRHVAMLEMSKLVPLLVRDFDFELHGDLQGQAMDMTSYLFVRPRNFKVRVRERQD